jgi:hypothetical protein
MAVPDAIVWHQRGPPDQGISSFVLHIERPPSRETGVFRSLPSAAALVRRAGFRGVQATGGVVEYQWTLDAFMHCSIESEDRELVDAMDAGTRGRLERLWTERLRRLKEADFRFRDRVAYVTGRRAS